MNGEPKLYENKQGVESCLINPAINKTLFLGNSLLWELSVFYWPCLSSVITPLR